MKALRYLAWKLKVKGYESMKNYVSIRQQERDNAFKVYLNIQKLEESLKLSIIKVLR